MNLFLYKLAAIIDGGDVPGIPRLTGDQVLTNVLNVFYFLIGVIAVITIIIAGIRYASSGGDAGKVTSAKNQILYSVIGVIVVMVAFTITNFVVGRL